MSIKTVLVATLLVPLCLLAGAQTARPSGGGTIEGDVVDGDTGQGIPGAQVKVNADEDGPRFTSTDGAGHFRFTGLAPKSYEIAARQIGFMGAEDSPHGSRGGQRVQPGQTDPVQIELVRYAVIAGTVTDSSGAPVSTVRVSVLQKVPVEARVIQRPERRLADGKNRLETVGHAFTDQRGAFRVARLQPGTYYIEAEPTPSGMPSDDRTSRPTYYGGALDLVGAKPIVATAGATFANINVEILKRAGVHVSGRVVAPAGQQGSAPESVFTSVSLQSLAGESGPGWGPYATVQGDHFEIQDVLPGKYTLTATMNPRNGRPEAREELSGALQTIEVGETDLSGLILALQPPRDLPGIVHLDQQCHPGKMSLTVSFRGLRDVAVGTDGAFVLKDLLPSRHWLRATIDSDSYATLGAVRLGGRESEGGFIMQGDDYGPLSVEVVCPRGNIFGEVRDASGGAARGALVAIVSAVEPGDRRLVRVGQDGTFDTAVRPGVYNVFGCLDKSGGLSFARDCQKAPGPLAIKDGTNARLALTLPADQPKEGSK